MQSSSSGVQRPDLPQWKPFWLAIGVAVAVALGLWFFLVRPEQAYRGLVRKYPVGTRAETILPDPSSPGTLHLTRIIDRAGFTNIFVADLRGNIVAETNAVGGIRLAAFDDNNIKTNEIVFLDGQPYATNRVIADEHGWPLVTF